LFFSFCRFHPKRVLGLSVAVGCLFPSVLSPLLFLLFAATHLTRARAHTHTPLSFCLLSACLPVFLSRCFR
jgi:hypothetical protein